MATKPVTFPNIWAGAGIYATGPFVGQPSSVDPGFGIADEGHRPGSLKPTAAEHENYQQFQLTTWVREWLARGEFTGTADAHIVETDANGRTQLVGLTLDDAVDETVLDITGANTLLPAVFVHSDATSFQADMGANPGVGFSVPIGAADGTGFSATMTNSSGGAAGLNVSADGTSIGKCVAVQHSQGVGVDVRCDDTGIGVAIAHSGSAAGLFIAASGTGRAIQVTGSPGNDAVTLTAGAAQRALLATASATSAYAAQFVNGTTYSISAAGSTNGGGGLFTGAGTGIGVAALSGTSAGANAVQALARNSTGYGLYAQTHTTAVSGVAGAFIEGRDSAAGAEITSANYYAVLLNAKTSTPTYPTIYVRPQTSYPSFSTDGTITFASQSFGNIPHFLRGSTTDGAPRGVWDSIGGFVYGASYNASAASADSVNYTSLTTAVCSAGNAPKQALGVVRLSVSLRVKTSAIGATGIDVQLRDVTPGVPVTIITYAGAAGLSTSGWYMPGTVADRWETSLSFNYFYVVPLAGARTFELRFKRQSGAVTITAQGSLVVTGCY